jgi:hypothetical protein
MSVPHAEVLFLHELASLSAPAPAERERYIRTIGVIDSYHVPSRTCVLSHKGASAVVDVELVRAELSVGSVYQVFGELQSVGAKV